MIDIFSLKVEELAAKIKDSQLTSVEICEKYIERVKKFEKDVVCNHDCVTKLNNLWVYLKPYLYRHIYLLLRCLGWIET